MEYLWILIPVGIAVYILWLLFTPEGKREMEKAAEEMELNDRQQRERDALYRRHQEW